MTALQERIGRLRKGMVAVLGVPLDENSSFMRGPALAPPRIREALRSGSSNMSTERGLDLGSNAEWADMGDLEIRSGTEALAQIEKAVSDMLATGARALVLGGDHSITYPVVRAYARSHHGLAILHIDAHADTYDEYEGRRYSHACPFARIMEEGAVSSLVQLGIRTLTPHQRQQAERFGISMVEMKDWALERMPELRGPVYVSLDMDGLDPAFAPGVSHHEPGGFSTRDVLQILHRLPSPVVGADIVEFNPTRDPLGITAMAAAKLSKELLGLMLQ